MVEIGLQIQVDQLASVSEQSNSQLNRISVRIEFRFRDKTHETGFLQLVDIQKYTVDVNSASLMCIGRAPNGKLRLIEWNHNHPLFRQVLEPIAEDYSFYDEEVDEWIEDQETILGDKQLTQEMLERSLVNLAQNLTFELKPSFSLRLTKDWAERRHRMGELLFPDFNGGKMFIPVANRSSVEESIAKERAAYNLVRYRLVKLLDQTLQVASEIVSSELNQTAYLGPLRSYPPYLLILTGTRASDLFSGKDDAWRVVGRDVSICEEVNRWIGAEWLRHLTNLPSAGCFYRFTCQIN